MGVLINPAPKREPECDPVAALSEVVRLLSAVERCARLDQAARRHVGQALTEAVKAQGRMA